jgi:tetratricopeptide (TPR) repeat protein
MVNLRPGVDADTRIAHLRWLKGDLTGAIAAMDSAARATSPQDAETLAWTLARLAGYYLQAGRFLFAHRAAESAVAQAPDYPPALLARGRALLALGDTGEASASLRRAAELNPLPEYQWWLADALRADGRAAESTALERQIVERGEAADPRTLSLFLATRHTKAARAVDLAREELTNRGDVFTHDALAWALAANGDLAAAQAEMTAALAEHTADARLYLHAGVIALARGECSEAETLFAQARPLAATLTPSERTLLGQHTAALLARAP